MASSSLPCCLRAAEIAVSRGPSRVKFDGLPETGDSLVQLALILQGEAEVVVGRSVFRIEFDRPAVEVDGLVQLALVHQSVAEVVEYGHTARPQRQSYLEVANRVLITSRVR